tara:strand:- start:164 stop:268 length:105 start_codon:yes stop_codon:yes gene_type:complete
METLEKVSKNNTTLLSAILCGGEASRLWLIESHY